MFLILLILWLVFAGSLSIKNLLTGIIISGLLTLFCTKFMGYNTKKFIKNTVKAGNILKYLGYLLKEIFVANIAVLKFIYSKKTPEPKLVKFRGGLNTEKARVILANSITLTPGTLTVGLENDEFIVHALDKTFAEGIENSTFAQKARELEK